MGELKVTLFRWLVYSNSLSRLEEQCDAVSGSVDLQQRVYRLVLPLDVADLLDYSGMCYCECVVLVAVVIKSCFVDYCSQRLCCLVEQNV